MTLVKKIKLLADKHKTTFAEIERKTGISNGQIRRWDKSSPKIDNIQKVADYFGVSTDYLLGRTNTQNINNEEQNKSVAKQMMYRMDTSGLDENEIEEIEKEVERFLEFRMEQIRKEKNEEA